MIQHTVCFTLDHPAGSEAEAEFLTAAAAVLPAIPGVDAFRIARQVSPQSSFQWQFSMEFSDRATYEQYNAHPDHVDFVEKRWAREVASFTEFDFEPYLPGQTG